MTNWRKGSRRHKVSKWEPVNPADLKPGDKFKGVAGDTAITGIVRKVEAESHTVHAGGECSFFIPKWEWFRRKPAKPTRPVEPPAGTVVRNTRSGVVGKHFAPLNDDDTRNWALLKIDGDSEWKKWDDWIAPTDEIEVAEWVKP